MVDLLLDNLLLDFLKKEGYTNIRICSNGNIVAIYRFIFTVAIISDINDTGYGDRWCYHTETAAIAALEAWNGIEGEPTGWHRHPPSGRRIVTVNH